MPYLQPEINNGYNPYLTIKDYPNVGMDVGLLVLEEGQSWHVGQAGQETALLLLEGTAELFWENRHETISRKNPFVEEASCLHLPQGMKATIKALSHCEIYLQSALNEKTFSPGSFSRMISWFSTRVLKMSCKGLCGGISRQFLIMNPPPGP